MGYGTSTHVGWVCGRRRSVPSDTHWLSSEISYKTFQARTQHSGFKLNGEQQSNQLVFMSYHLLHPGHNNRRRNTGFHTYWPTDQFTKKFSYQVTIPHLFNTPLSDRNVTKRRYITPKLSIVINFFFFLLIDNLIKFCYKQRISHQLKNSSLLLTINEYCMFHIEGFFSQQLFLYFIS